jgi:tetratricopeptide (TPR) repeat protein
MPVRGAISHPPPAAVDLLPADVAGVLLFNTDDLTWQDLSRFGLFPPDLSTPGWLLEAIIPGSNFHTDIQPWLGDKLALGYLATGDMVAITPVKDATLIPAFLERVKAAKQKPAQELLDQGISILFWPPETIGIDQAPPSNEEPDRLRLEQVPPSDEDDDYSHQVPEPSTDADTDTDADAEGSDASSNPPDTATFQRPGFAIAYLPSGYIVSAQRPEAIQTLLAQQSPGKRLIDRPTFQRTIRDPRAETALVLGFGNDYGAILAATIQSRQPRSDQQRPFPPQPPSPLPIPIPTPAPDALQAMGKLYDAIDGYLWAEPTGLRAQASVYLSQPLPLEVWANANNPNQILEQLPGVTYGLVNNQNLAALWRGLNQGIEQVPGWQARVSQLRELSQRWIGTDDRDWLPWMDQEYAFFAFPAQRGLFPSLFQTDLGFGLALQTSNREAAEAALTKLSYHVTNQYNLQLRERTLDGASITHWTLPTSGNHAAAGSSSLFAYSWVQPDTLVLTTGSGVGLAGILPSGPALTQSPNFQDAIAPLPHPNLGYFYINSGAVLSLVFNSLLPSLLEPEMAQSPLLDGIKSTLGSIRSLAGTSAVGRDRLQTDGFLALGVTRSTPPTALEWMEYGEQHLSNRQVQWAIANFTQALKQEPENAKAYFQRGQARREAGDLSGAQQDLTHAQDLFTQQGDATGVAEVEAALQALEKEPSPALQP